MVELTPDQIRIIQEISKQFGVSDVRVFGSFAKGNATAKSDIDLLLKFPPGGGLIPLIAFQQELEEHLNRPVDVVEDHLVPNAELNLILAHARLI